MTTDEKITLDNLSVWAKMVARQIEDLNARITRLEPNLPVQETQTPAVERFYHPVPFEIIAEACHAYRIALWGVSGPEAAGRLAALDAKYPMVTEYLLETHQQQTPTQ